MAKGIISGSAPAALGLFVNLPSSRNSLTESPSIISVLFFSFFPELERAVIGSGSSDTYSRAVGRHGFAAGSNSSAGS